MLLLSNLTRIIHSYFIHLQTSVLRDNYAFVLGAITSSKKSIDPLRRNFYFSQGIVNINKMQVYFK